MTPKNITLLAVVNPVSGALDKESIVRSLKEKMTPQQQLHIFTTTGDKDKQRLRDLLETYRPDRVIIVGGDGTLQLVVNLCDAQKPIIGIVPAGSTNGFAAELQLLQNIDGAIAVALGTNTLVVDALQLDRDIILHTADLGLNAELIQRYEGITYPSGIRHTLRFYLTG